MESNFSHNFRIRNSVKRKPNSKKLFKNSGVEFLDPLPQDQSVLFLDGGKGYNSAVECHLDVVEVISSSPIIPKPNVSFSICMP